MAIGSWVVVVVAELCGGGGGGGGGGGRVRVGRNENWRLLLGVSSTLLFQSGKKQSGGSGTWLLGVFLSNLTVALPLLS